MIENIVDVIEAKIDSMLDDVHTILPGQIESYYGHSQRKAKVKPLVRIRTSNNDLIEISPIDDVPVIFPSSSKFQQLWKLEKGDGVLLLFSESSLGNFLNSSGIQDADDENQFDLTDCIAIPGLWSFQSIPKLQITTNNSDFYLIYQGTSIQIKDKTNEIIIKDTIGNTIETKNTGICIEDFSGNTIETKNTGINIQDFSGNTIETLPTSVKINGSNFEVLNI